MKAGGNMYRITLVPMRHPWINFTHFNGCHKVEFRNGIAYTSDKVLLDEFRQFPNKYRIEKMEGE